MESINWSELSDEELNNFMTKASAELAARTTIRDAERDVERIVEEAEERRKSLAANYLLSRDREYFEDGSEAPEWVQPTGAHDVYPEGYRVSYGGKVWVSRHPANAWAPGTTNSQWIEEIPEVEGGEAPVIEWGPGQAIKVGDIRTFNGKTWRAVISHVSHAGWLPDSATYAVWELVEDAPVEEPGDEPTDTYPEWSKDASYKIGDKVTKDGHLWECLVAHGAEYQGTWAPPAASVWKDLGAA